MDQPEAEARILERKMALLSEAWAEGEEQAKTQNPPQQRRGSKNKLHDMLAKLGRDMGGS